MSTFWDINHTEQCVGWGVGGVRMLFIFRSSHTYGFRALISTKIHVKCLSLSFKKKCLQQLASGYLLCNHLTTKVNDLLWCLMFLCSGFVLFSAFCFTHTKSDPSFMEELRKIIRNEVLKIFEGILCTHFPYCNIWYFCFLQMTVSELSELPRQRRSTPPGLTTKHLWLPAQHPGFYTILSFSACFWHHKNSKTIWFPHNLMRGLRCFVKKECVLLRMCVIARECGNRDAVAPNKPVCWELFSKNHCKAEKLSSVASISIPLVPI